MATEGEGYSTEGLSEETAKLAAMGRGEDLSEGTEGEGEGEAEKADAGADEVPEWVPEKFRKEGKPDYEAMAKAYGELEKKLGAPKGDGDGSGDEDEGEDEEESGEGDKGGEEAADPREAFTSEVQALVGSARDEYAANGGELKPETYEKLTGLLGKDYVDTYLSGVKALEVALEAEVYQVAGGEDAYKAAVEWARENWSDKQVEKFDSALADNDLRSSMIKGLMADFREANPGEGSFTEKGTGVVAQDVYTDAEEFTNDLQAADEANDALARRKAVQKLQRSKKAGTLSGITPRNKSRGLPQG